MSLLRPEDSFDSCATPAVSKRRRPVLLSVDIGSPTYQSCLKVSRQDDSSRLNTANMSFSSDLLDRSYTSAASSMRAQGMFSSRSLHLQSLHCSPLSHTKCGLLRAVETSAGFTACSAAAVLAPCSMSSFANDVSHAVVKDWFQDAIASSRTVFHVEVDLIYCSQQFLRCAANLGVLKQVGDNSITLSIHGPAVDVGFSSEWALLLRSTMAPPPSPIEYIKTPITPFGDLMLDESSFDFSSSLTSELSNHSACSGGNFAERAFTDARSAEQCQSLEVVLVLRSDDPPWVVSRVGIIEATHRSDSPPPAPRAAAAPASRMEVGEGAAMTA